MWHITLIANELIQLENYNEIEENLFNYVIYEMASLLWKPRLLICYGISRNKDLASDDEVIGQFGVGFYSTFLIAKKDLATFSGDDAHNMNEAKCDLLDIPAFAQLE
ncbi:uncharacterized protein LOC116007255 [Ipomoea triloba]|uniref:uncharacterized protein LOC116007255 n=1 Tax=Ipomoea triloba TaxID=35885 RepID=UPI00125DCA47|nr:uncharacterized protein LOC116007255 [Ipomoea triloba]XP_031103742.1 uncharacterized protein LOC116007255 [Ipomoea triloba]XP_031103744.1 uncharacterized protein LOC116007255 [Ipomoea triloba]XP_031103745.1 uncharacterized protein LOC116007255 [Ipomoea triloba]